MEGSFSGVIRCIELLHVRARASVQLKWVLHYSWDMCVGRFAFFVFILLQQRLLVLTTTQETARIVTGLYKGARALVVGSMIGSDTIIARAGEVAKEWGWAKAGDALVAVHGMLEGRPGSTNLVKVLSVP